MIALLKQEHILDETYLKPCYENSAAEIRQNSDLQEEIDLWEKTTGDGIDPSNTENW